MGDHGVDTDAAFLEQGQVILPDGVGAQPIETPTSVTTKVLHDADVAPNRGRGVLAPHELVVQPLKQLGHRQPLLRRSLRLYEQPGRPSAAAPAASFKSRRVE